MNKIKRLFNKLDSKVTATWVTAKSNIKFTISKAVSNPRQANLWQFAGAVAALIIIAVIVIIVIGSGSSDDSSLLGMFKAGVSKTIGSMFSKADSTIG